MQMTPGQTWTFNFCQALVAPPSGRCGDGSASICQQWGPFSYEQIPILYSTKAYNGTSFVTCESLFIIIHIITLFHDLILYSQECRSHRCYRTETWRWEWRWWWSKMVHISYLHSTMFTYYVHGKETWSIHWKKMPSLGFEPITPTFPATCHVTLSRHEKFVVTNCSKFCA